ncbi:MAG TPA: TonB family protein [Blastocatellia bacterium]|jgi:TonB family protein
MLSPKHKIVVLAVVMSCGLSVTARVQNEKDITPLMRAVRDGKSGEVKKLLKQGVDLEAKDGNGWTALFYAVAMGDDRAVKALLDKGANVNAKSNEDQTSLMLAALYQDDKIVSLLIARGADVKAADKNGDTALTMAARGGRAKAYDLIHKAGGVEPEAEGVKPREGQSFRPDLAENITRPIPLNRPRPNYTNRARAENVTGVVRVRALVGTDGQVKIVRVMRGLPAGLTQQAVGAVFKMKFKPAMKDGNPVEYWVPVEIEFNLARRS